MLGCIAQSPGLVFYQAQACCCHRLHILLIRVHLYFFEGFILVKYVCLLPPPLKLMFSWDFEQWVIYGEECGLWTFGDDLHPQFDSVEFHTFEIYTIEDNVPLINPNHPFILLPNHPQIFKHIPLIPVLILFQHGLFCVQIFNIYREIISNSVLSLRFFYKLWPCNCFFLQCRFSHQHNTIFETTINKIITLFKPTLHFISNTGEYSVSRRVISKSFYSQVTQATI